MTGIGMYRKKRRGFSQLKKESFFRFSQKKNNFFLKKLHIVGSGLEQRIKHFQQQTFEVFQWKKIDTLS
jgi:hypothetical protein